MAKLDVNVNGISRNPFHPKGGDVFAINMDDLEFSINDQPVPARNVVGAFPHVRALVVFKRDANDEVMLNHEGRPDATVMKGDVKVIGQPESCGCPMSRFQVVNWWNEVLSVK